MATSDELTAALARAQAHVRGIDWASWQVPPGDARLAEYLFANQPPLTNGLMATYLSTCSWIWARPIGPEEQQRAAVALTAVWAERGRALEFEPLLDVLGFVALSDQLLTLPPTTLDEIRQELSMVVPDGRFPGVDIPVPGADVPVPGVDVPVPGADVPVPGADVPVPDAVPAAAIEQAQIPVSTLSAPDETGVALDGLYSATTFGLQLDVTGPPGSGTWGSTIEFYAFFPDGTYYFFPSASEVGRHIEDPVGHKALGGQYEVSAGTIRLYDVLDGRTNSSAFSATPDGAQIKFYGKDFTRVGDTANLRLAPSG